MDGFEEEEMIKRQFAKNTWLTNHIPEPIPLWMVFKK